MSSSDFDESLVRLGFNAFFQAQVWSLASSELALGVVPARVISEARGRYSLSTGEHALSAVLAGHLQHAGEYAAVGDFVLVERPSDSLGRITRVLERSSSFQRRDPNGTSVPQTIAANIDLAIVVAAHAPDEAPDDVRARGLNPRRIERYLRAIRDAPARAIVVVNKADQSASFAAQTAELARELRNVPVISTSVQSGAGLQELSAELLPGSTAVLVGSSGVGKSSLTNALLGRSAQGVGDVRADDTRGRHTTTGRELFTLPSGALLLDTPGMRQFAPLAHDDDGLTGFPEIDELAPSCRFRDCKHENEPGCAVLAAVEAGTVEGARLSQAQKLERELAYQRGRLDPRKQGEKIARHKAQAKASRALQKSRWKSG